MSDIGEAIRAARRQLDWTQRQLAEAADVDIKTVSRIEIGKSRNPSKADKLMRVLRIGIHDAGTGDRRDPRLSEASMSELLAAVAARYGQAIRAAERATNGDAPFDTRGYAAMIEDLPPDIRAAIARGEIPGRYIRPAEDGGEGGASS